MPVHRAYIDTAKICSPFLRYTWDEWNVRPTYEPVNVDEILRFKALSKRANCAFTIAIAEWILARYESMDNDPEPGQFLEAAWAANIDIEYAGEIDIVDSEWTGPIRGPVSMALTFVLDAIFAEESSPNSAFNPAWAACFARHVLPDVSAFNSWFDFCLTRLEPLYPAPAEEDLDWFDEKNNLGELVPLEVFEPGSAFDSTTAPALINRFLSRLDPELNPFLRSADEMIADRFVGEPYSYAA